MRSVPMNRVGTLSGGPDSKGGLTISKPQQILDLPHLRRHRRQARCAARRMPQVQAQGPLPSAQPDREMRPQRQHDEMEGA